MKRTSGIIALACCAGVAHADDLSVIVGQDFSQGDYGAESESNIGVTSFGARLRLGEWAFRATGGYVDLGEDPDTIISGPRGRTLVIRSDDAVKGFTDFTLGVSGPLLDETDTRPAITFSGSVKLPTADEEQGLGTGATDFGASVEFSKTFGSFVGYAYSGGRIRGESDVIDVRNSVDGGFGLQRLFGRNWIGSVGYDYRGASFEGGEDAHEVSALVSYRATASTNISAYVYTGFTEVSPDIGFGFFVSQRIMKW